MGKALTALAVDKLQPGTARREVPDGLVAGLYLVVQPSGAKSWAVRYRTGSTTRKHTLGSFPKIDLISARDLARNALLGVAKGSDPSADKKVARAAAKAAPAVDRDRLDKVVSAFVERYAKPNTRASSAKEYERVLKKEVVDRWPGKRLSSISRADVHDMLDSIVDRGSPVQANRTLAAFRKLCAWAVERGYIEVSPCEKVKPPSSERSRDRVLADDELKVIWTACDGMGWPFAPLVRMLMLTGQRRDEVGQLPWSEVDLEAGMWVLPAARAKNGVEHAIPLSAPALTLLRSLPQVGPYVFSTNGKTPVSGFSKAKLRVDKLAAQAREGRALPEWIFHDLRRTAATGMARLGIGLPVIERVLNHVSGSFGGIVGVYQRHSFADEKRHALQSWGGFVERLTTEQPAGNMVEMARAAT